VSWQGHLCGGIAGVIVAWRLSVKDHRHGPDTHEVLGAPTA
jgi:membrane associated rhomboid family serine protease